MTSATGLHGVNSSTSEPFDGIRVVGLGNYGPATFDYPPGSTFGPRPLPDFEFVWLLTGSGSYSCQTAAGQTRSVDLRPGMLLLAQPTGNDYYQWDPAEVTRHAYVHFRLPDGQSHRHDEWPLVRELTTADPMAALCRYLEWLPTSANRAALSTTATATIELLLRLFLHGPLPAAEPAPANVHVDTLIDWLGTYWRRHGMSTVSVPQMAAAVGVSSGHLSRVCRQHLGTAPAEMVELLRLARAALLLQRSNLTVGQVARTCGFVDAFHFSHRFRQVYRRSPRDYRHSGDDALTPLSRAGLLTVAHRLAVTD